MRKYISIAIAAIVLVACLQGFNIYLQTQEFCASKQIAVTKTLAKTIDEEYSMRAHKSYNPFAKGEQHFKYKEVPAQVAEKSTPLPSEVINLDEIDVQDLRNKGIVDGEMEILGLLAKDNLEKRGKHLDYKKLDSIFIKNLGENLPHTFTLIDVNKNVIERMGDSCNDSNWLKSKDVAIGLKPVRYLNVLIDIPTSSFIKSSIWTLIGTVILALLIIFCICAQLLIIKKKERLLKNKEVSIHGTIHNLKAPLGTIVFILSYIQKNIKDQELKGFIQRAEKEIEALADNIKRILMTAKGNAIGGNLHKEKIYLMEIAGYAKAHVDANYANKPHHITLCDHREIVKSINADKALIETAIRNLLENAIKYSADGVLVNLDIYEVHNKVIIKIKDTGYGIDDKYKKKIFQQFFCIPTDHPKEGYGIGLALVKYAIEAHNGNIKVESELGKGSCFTITLPI